LILVSSIIKNKEMSNLKISSAEHADNHRRFLFIAMLLMSLVFAIKAGFHFVDDEMKSYLEVSGKILFGLSMIVVVITIYWKLRFLPRNERYYLLTSSDSYANLMMIQAYKISWILTLIFLAVIPSMIIKVSPVLPARFYIDLTLFFMLAVCSLSFFILFLARDKEEYHNSDL
jgi:hypothetical protein